MAILVLIVKIHLGQSLIFRQIELFCCLLLNSPVRARKVSSAALPRRHARLPRRATLFYGGIDAAVLGMA